MENKLEQVDKVLNKISDGREYRNVREIRIAETTDENEKRVTGYATVFNEPYLLYDWGDYKVYEIIDRHAFDECDMSDVIMQYDHEGRVFARKSNGTLTIDPDDRGLRCDADLSGTTIGQQLYEEIKGGYTTKMSFGFRIAEQKREVVEDMEHNMTTVTRTITKIARLYDVSAVSLPANDATEISARSYCEGVIAELQAERLEIAEKIRKRKLIKILSEA